MPDLASVLEQARVPEHSAPFMQAMSQGTAFLEGEYLFLTADDWLMAIGYPLSGEYAHETFERALAAALRRVPKRLEGVDCWAIGPDLPARLAGHVTDRDTFYILPCDAPVPARLRRPVETAAEKLTVREGRDFTPAHRRLWAEFMNRAVLPPNVRGLFARTGAVLDTPGLRLLDAVDAEGNEIVFDKDQGIRRDTTLEKMASMKPCFRENGRVTAATSSQTSDGAAFLVLMSRDKAAEMGIRPLASFLGFCVGGLDPAYMGLGPIYAAPKVLEYTGLTMDDMDVIELNEAFAAQVSPCIRELGMDPARVNPNGGAMALGHPLGATGGRILTTLVHGMKRTRTRYGIATLCMGGGQGGATLLELAD